LTENAALFPLTVPQGQVFLPVSLFNAAAAAALRSINFNAAAAAALRSINTALHAAADPACFCLTL
jgi:hypothetical protein